MTSCSGFHRLYTRSVIAATILIVVASSVAAQTPSKAEIVAIYDSGDYARARTLIEQRVAKGTAEGAMLYRLSFCQLRTNDEAASRKTLELARQTLEREVSDASDIEIPFYLVNTYQNLNRADDVIRIARAATGKIESGEMQADSAVEQFRVAKLYSDLGYPDKANTWYSRSLDGFRGKEKQYQAYVNWARDYIARQTSQTEVAPAPAAAIGGTGPAGDLDRRAVEHAREGRYNEAAAAWQEAGRSNPPDANRPRYSARLALMAGELGSLPDRAPSGSTWSALNKQQLEAVLLEQAMRVREARKQAGEAKKLKKKLRTKLESELAAAKPIFVAAGLQYTMRGYGIREVAFFGGYAPLIFRAQEWQLPSPE